MQVEGFQSNYFPISHSLSGDETAKEKHNEDNRNEDKRCNISLNVPPFLPPLLSLPTPTSFAAFNSNLEYRYFEGDALLFVAEQHQWVLHSYIRIGYSEKYMRVTSKDISNFIPHILLP